MKCVSAILILSLQLANSAFAAQVTSETEVEDSLRERQTELRNKTPLNKDEKDFLKRMLSDKTLQYTKDVSDERPERRNLESSNALSDAMRKSGEKKVRRAEKKANRKLQNYYGYGGNYGGNYGATYGGNYGGYGYGGYYGNQAYNGGQAYQYGNAPVSAYSPHVPKADIPEKVSMVLEAFQDSRFIEQPILLTPETSYLDAGTQYVWSDAPLFNVVYDTPPGANRAAYLVNERDRIATASGTCVRTDPKQNYVGRAYCQYEYKFVDRQGNLEATLIAEGPITKGDINTLSITGGSGIFRRTVGTVVLETGNIRAGNPPFFIPNDRLDLPSSYLVSMYVFMDSVDLELQ